MPEGQASRHSSRTPAPLFEAGYSGLRPAAEVATELKPGTNAVPARVRNGWPTVVSGGRIVLLSGDRQRAGLVRPRARLILPDEVWGARNGRRALDEVAHEIGDPPEACRAGTCVV